MSHTSDNDKKAKDNQAKQEQKNKQYLENAQNGKHSFSKQTDHL